jgi:hypothetical protein
MINFKCILLIKLFLIITLVARIKAKNSGKKGKNSTLIPIEGDKIFTAYEHGLGFTPVGILYDLDTNQAISGNTFLQNIDNTSFRLLYLLSDNNYFYIKGSDGWRRTSLEKF